MFHMSVEFSLECGMKWSEAFCKIVESFNQVGRPGYALAALALMLIGLPAVIFAFAYISNVAAWPVIASIVR